MNSQTKSAIKSLVLDLRHTLEDELTVVLRRYGVFTDRKWPLDAPPARLTDDADREIWQRIVAVVKRGIKEGRTVPQASADYIRESAFTFLNWLVGLKCLEVRRIIDEVITTRDIYGGRSKAHRDYRDEHPRQARAPDDALPACLKAVCRRVNDELIGYLFDPDDDHSLVWPRYAVLKRCIEKISALDEAAWQEDEIIGWIYQFYNAEVKAAVRKRGKPQTPHEVAVINQFFTPRWIVKFLVDNTLGRLWLEMHPYSPRVREKCTYLVPEPLPTGDSQSSILHSPFSIDPDSPVNSSHAAPRREPKPITQVRLLDPACGTMHFGHYACEVFEAMYRDARDRGEVQIEDRRIPSAILEYNLFGVDIDRRAVQLAALSLFMKARTMHPEAQVRQVNLVAADATMPDSGVKKKFLARYAHDKRLQRAFAQVLDDMDQVAQVGSLLRVEERLRELLARAGHAAVADELRALDPRRQRELPGPALSGAEGMEPDVRQMGLAEVAVEDDATEWTPHYTLQELRDDLRAFARQALQEHDVNAQLFAAEADKAVRLLDVLMDEYDVIVMNPPYGEATHNASRYLNSNYPSTKSDIYSAFLEQGLAFLRGSGYLGSLTSRTYLTLSSFKGLRQDILYHQGFPSVLLDLGFGILDDAVVETCATVLCADTRLSWEDCLGIFLRLNAFAGNRSEMFQTALQVLWDGKLSYPVYCVPLAEFLMVPSMAIGYWAPTQLRQKFHDWKSLAPSVAHVKQGLATADDQRFVRHHWEVSPHTVGILRKWVPFAKGGDYSKFYYDHELVVNWANNGQAIKNYRWPSGRQRSRPQNERFYFREGLSYVYVTVKGFNVRYLPADHIFGHAGNSIFPRNPSYLWPLLGLLNSGTVQFLLSLLTDSRKYEVGYVSSIPVPELAGMGHLGDCARDAYGIKAMWDTGNEICTRFTQPWLLQLTQSQGQAFAGGLGCVLALLDDDAPAAALPPEPFTLTALLDHVRAIEKAADARLQALQAQIDEAVYDLYEIRSADRALIERELGDRPPELVWPQMENKSDREKRREHVRRFFSYYARQAVRADEDGVVPLVGCAVREPYLVDRVRAQLEAQFGPSVAYQLEQDAAAHLGRPLEEWLHRYFFGRFHVKLYKKRPVLWHLTSPRRHFAVMVDYHRLTRDTLPKVQTLYLWPQMEAVRTRLAAAGAGQALVRASFKTIADLEDELADLEDCNRRLESVIQGAVEVTLPEWANGPYRDGKAPYDPDLDDGIKVNLLPIQEAGLLPVKKIV